MSARGPYRIKVDPAIDNEFGWQTEGEYWRDRGYRAVMRYAAPNERYAAMMRRRYVKKHYHGNVMPPVPGTRSLRKAA